MNPDWLLKHFEQISEAPDPVPRLRRFCTKYRARVAPIPQMPSGKLVPKKSQMASGQSQGALPELSVRISQTSSAKSAATFPVKKRLMEWAEAVLQNESGRRRP